ncbi:putative ribonuclease H-like domain-containing protein [Tanacetum coccineum]
MEFESTNSGTTAKLPILKLGEYEMWVIRIKQYFQIQDYALWEVIENGDSWVSVPQTTQENGTSVTKMSIPSTYHQIKYPDAKSMFAAIETRFGGNAATKKTQKTLLKQQYENFSASSAESLDSIFNRLQKIVSRLAILGVVIAQEDLNSNFLSSLPPEWNTHVVVWMNKPEVETMSIDDLYNNFKIVEQKVKKSVGTSSGAQNLAFMTAPSTSSTNDANTASPQVSTASPNVNAASPQVSTASVSDNTVYAFIVENPNGSNVLHQDLEQIHEDNLEAMDLKCQLSLRAKKEFGGTKIKEGQFRNQDNTRKQGNNEDTSSKAMLAIDGVGFDWSDMAEEQVQTNMALMAFSDSENEVLFSEEVAVLKREVACKDYEINVLKSEFEKVKQEKDGIDFKIEKFDKASKDLDQLLGSLITDKRKKGLGPEIKDHCKYHQRERMVYGNNYNRVNYNYTTNRIHSNAQRNMVLRAVLMKTGLKPSNTAMTINTAHPKSIVFSAEPMSHFSKSAQSTARRPYQSKTVLTNKKFTQTNNTAKAKAVNTVRPKVVNTARPHSAVVNIVRINQANAVKASTCWGKPQQDDTGFINSGCSRHMTRNIAYLSDFKEFDGDVYFVNELNFNIFSVSQMCDKKNYVLFTDTECLVLSPNFKLPDESQILLKIPRKDNMYSFDMKNIVPKESLTCLVAKATSDESMLWHRRLGHINFKNINKLVKDNLVRGLPTKRFENDQTCVACLKGKQHRASCKSKVLNPITKPLFMLHMDLFGPTFVSSLMHKKYCLVVTDDYSRFTWVFFLTTKDETSEILKNFIKEIENLVDKKVKIIRSDNGTEFKNKVMDDFCREKGIKREYSVARTPQQNGVAERRNRTLIEAARTMLADSKLPTTFWAEAVSTACYVQNRVLVVKPHNKTPYELFRGFKPALSFMRPFGCHVTILNTLDNLGKFDGKSDEGFFVGYSLSSKAFRVYNTRTRRVEENLHIGFLENKPMIEGNGPKWLFDIDSLTQSMNYVPVAAGTISNESAGTQGELNADKSEDDERPKEVNAAEQHVNTASPEVNIGRLKLNTFPTTPNTRIHKDHPIKNVISGCEVIYSDKKNDINLLLKKGFSVLLNPQALLKLYLIHLRWKQCRKNFCNSNSNSFIAPVEETKRQYRLVFSILLSLYGFSGNQIDVKSSILYGTIEEEVYVTQPPRFKDPDNPDKVYKVVKQKEDRIFISQDKYVDEILKKFNYTDVKYASTPVDLEKPLVKDGDANDVDVHLYRSMIGSLMYLTTSRPNIIFAVCACARFQVTLKTSHLLAVKRIFRYLKGKPTLGL